MTRRGFLAVGVSLFVSAYGEPIRRAPVESSNLKSVGFDSKTETLEVEFIHGGVYCYFDVPEEVYAALMKAESKGGFFQKNVRGKFPFKRISGGK